MFHTAHMLPPFLLQLPDRLQDVQFSAEDHTVPLRPLFYLFLGIGLVLLTLLLGYLLLRLRKRMRPWLVFLQASRTLGLTLAEQWWLYRIARQEQLYSPLTLLVCDATLPYHARRVAQRWPAPLNRQLLSRINAIRSRLFA